MGVMEVVLGEFVQQEENSSWKYQHLELQKRNLEKKVAVRERAKQWGFP